MITATEKPLDYRGLLFLKGNQGRGIVHYQHLDSFEPPSIDSLPTNVK